MKPNILQFITGLNPGGAEMMLLKTLNNLDDEKYNLSVASLTGGKLESQFRKHNLTVLNCNRMITAPFAVLKLRKLLKRKQIDIVHSYLFHANIIARLAAIGLRTKVISSLRIKETGIGSHVLIDKLTKNLVDHYTAVSDAVRKFAIETEHIPSNKITTIRNGLDFKQFNIKVNADKKRKELGINKNARVIVSVANLRASKDYATLFHALKEAEEANIVLLVVGDGEQRQQLEKMVKELRIPVVFLGYRNDVLELLSIADICVLSTHYEGQSNALLEYMAMSKPIIATDIEENREVIDKHSGILVPPKQPKIFAEVIKKILHDPSLAKQLGENAHKRVKQLHDIKRVVRQTEELYEKLL